MHESRNSIKLLLSKSTKKSISIDLAHNLPIAKLAVKAVHAAKGAVQVYLFVSGIDDLSFFYLGASHKQVYAAATYTIVPMRNKSIRHAVVMPVVLYCPTGLSPLFLMRVSMYFFNSSKVMLAVSELILSRISRIIFTASKVFVFLFSIVY